ncbi:hypothetical protein ACTJKO_13730 [Curtobacterium sp. 22159]|uniref:hypothetical protein n=1 Tax=Curtobacterium sp. 22159 TaxID=3453882 RepID=UPI003F85A664
MEDLLAGAERVDAPPRTVRRAVGLLVSLVALGAAIAVAGTSAGGAVVATVVRWAMGRWAEQS